MAKDPELLAHQQWLGYLQPVGLVVSPPALLQAQAHVNANVATKHQRFLEHVAEKPVVGRDQPLVTLKDLRGLLLDVFGWQAGDLVGAADPRLAALEVVLPEYHETLRPTFAVPDDPRATPPTWLLLIQELPAGTPLDEVATADERHWQATPCARFERLLRGTEVPIGLLCNGSHLRLVYAPRGETAGHVTFPVQAMTEVAGRPIFSALLMLLGQERLFSLPDKQRLPAILSESRKYQNTVSTELAGQVLAALYELLRGFQSAHDLHKGELLQDVLERDPDSVYAGLLTVLMRLVFLLYAEDRGLMSDDEVYVKHYSVTGLFERLRADEGRYPDTMDLRYGAWAQLLVLFRMVHDGCRHGGLRLPARHGYLFDPDRYPFLEGRALGSQRQPGERLVPPLVSDGVIFRVLQNLLVLDGERISYRSLDVEQIGSVYEAIMGFRLEKAQGRSIAIKPVKAHGAPVTINLEALQQVQAKDRGKWVKENAEQAITGAALNALKEANTPEGLVAALERKVARDLTPNIVPAGAMVLQPSDERRRSGSHYTPRSLTGPIVRKALEPVLKGLGEQPKLEQVLGLKVCDPAMGSGAFLVEACRQLGEVLLKAWGVHGGMPRVPDDETAELFAQRTVAQRCLYGVDKNPMAVDLAKLSLWLVTLAKDHPFTFLDHALRCGDSLVGLTRQQICRFHWKEGVRQMLTGQEKLVERITAATRSRQAIVEGGEYMSPLEKAETLALADESLGLVRFAGNVVASAFFSEDNDRKRQGKRDDLLAKMTEYLQGNLAMRPTAAEQELRAGPKGITPFHWEIEFPEVFGRQTPGFDCIVGNPPFLGGTRITSAYGNCYRDWLAEIHPEGSSNADLSAHFFRRSFSLLRTSGCFGLLATNSIAQGDTRVLGLETIVSRSGSIFAATRRYRWPGEAVVLVSVVHVQKAASVDVEPILDGRQVVRITAFLYSSGGDKTPVPLRSNSGKSFRGCDVFGIGFVFDDQNKNANSLADMQRLIQVNPRNSERLFHYLGGEEFNSSPSLKPSRYIIDFGEMSEEEARKWPDLFAIVEERVKPARAHVTQRDRRELWWLYATRSPNYRAFVSEHKCCLGISQISDAFAIGFVENRPVVAHSLITFALHRYADFCLLQSRIHESWAKFFGSSLEERFRYTTTDCFDTFPFPWPAGQAGPEAVELAGRGYYEFRAELMIRNNEGLTKTYNRFHDPNATSADILKLRELHAAMDRAVLDAYGGDLAELTLPPCEFLLDYEDEEDEDEPQTGRQRKKPWRYRWPDDFRDEVLALLLELNRQRAEQEQLAGATAQKQTRSRSKRTKAADNSPNLYT
jgi:hypothetical protein